MPEMIASLASDKPLVNFYEAMDAVLMGGHVTRVAWLDATYYGTLSETDILQLHKPNGVFYDWIVCRADMVAEDWIIL